MDMSIKLDDLRQWLVRNGGSLHPNLTITHNEESGVHVRATADVNGDECFCTVPHSLALSSLNSYVDDDFARAKMKQSRLGPHAVGYFYLMHQYINKDKSFWKPYLESLPLPEDDHLTPFWFDDQDMVWLKGTDVYHTTMARKKAHEEQYRDGIELLRRAGFDTSLYTWDLFRWAITMFTSRSFSSRAIHPESKYWAAYKMSFEGRRQTVLLDLSRTPAQDLDFPVLFPVADAANHRPEARAEWAFDPGRFSISIKDPVQNGHEFFNNYGPKGNAELLLGYGFCIVDNPHDGVLLTLKPPPDDLQSRIREVHHGYFDAEGEWSGEKVTFNLGRMAFDPAAPVKVFDHIPEPLLELMYYILRHERGLPFYFVENPLEYLLSTSNGRRYLPHIARMIVQSLGPKLAQLTQGTPDGEPTNKRQEQAKIYRDGQKSILESITGALRSFTRSMLPSNSPSEHQGSVFLTLEGLVVLLTERLGRQKSGEFLAGIEASMGTVDVDQLRHAGCEDDVVVLLLCYMALCYSESDNPREFFDDMMPEYLQSESFWNCEVQGRPTASTNPTESEALQHAETLLQIVAHSAQQASPGSIWHSSRWTSGFIATFGGKFILYDSLLMMVPVLQDGNKVGEEARPVVYIHKSR